MDVVGDDIIVSMETAARIREASRRDGFLRQWRVGILLDEGKMNQIGKQRSETGIRMSDGCAEVQAMLAVAKPWRFGYQSPSECVPQASC